MIPFWTLYKYIPSFTLLLLYDNLTYLQFLGVVDVALLHLKVSINSLFSLYAPPFHVSFPSYVVFGNTSIKSVTLQLSLGTTSPVVPINPLSKVAFKTLFAITFLKNVVSFIPVFL